MAYAPANQRLTRGARAAAWPTYKSPIAWSQIGKFHLHFYASNLEGNHSVCVSICQKRVELLESTCMFLNNAMDLCREMEMYHFWLILRQIWQTAVRGSKCLSKFYKPFGMIGNLRWKTHPYERQVQ